MFTLLSCTEQQARKPIQQSKSQHIENSVQENQLRLAREVEVIEHWLTSQTSAFSETPHGIFYSYSNPKNRPILPPENLKKFMFFSNTSMENQYMIGKYFRIQSPIKMYHKALFCHSHTYLLGLKLRLS